MSLTVATDLQDITLAVSTTGWTNITAGGAAAVEPDFFAQGAQCLSRAVSGVGTTKGMAFDFGAGIDFTSGVAKDKLVYIWVYTTTPGLIGTRASGNGLVVRLATSSATADFRDFYVGGSDTLSVFDGFVCYVIDPQSSGSATSGAYSAASVQFFGAYMTTGASAKGQNLAIDAIRYGRGELRVSGSVTTPGKGFAEIAAADFGTVDNRYGIVTVKEGILFVKGKIALGSYSGTTSFSSRNETVIWQTPDYYNVSAQVVKQIPDASLGSTSGFDALTTYNGLAVIGSSGTTNVDFGVQVGADQGRSGSTLQCVSNGSLTSPGRTKAAISTSNGILELGLYASTFVGFEGGIDFAGTNLPGDNAFGNTFSENQRITSDMEMRNTIVQNSLAGTLDGALLWNADTDFQSGIFINNTRAIVFETAGTFSFIENLFSGNTIDVRNESSGTVVINVTDGDTPTYENDGSSWTIVNNTVTLSVLVQDTQSPPVGIQNVRVSIRRRSNDTSIFDGLTNASGIATSSTYNYAGDETVYIWARKTSTADTPRYINGEGSGTILSTGLSATITLLRDPNV